MVNHKIQGCLHVRKKCKNKLLKVSFFCSVIKIRKLRNNIIFFIFWSRRTTTERITEKISGNYNCDFEANTTCGWRNVHTIDDELDWTLFQGSTPSTGTGPSADHTLQNPAGKFKLDRYN